MLGMVNNHMTVLAGDSKQDSTILRSVAACIIQTALKKIASTTHGPSNVYIVHGLPRDTRQLAIIVRFLTGGHFLGLMISWLYQSNVGLAALVW